MKSKFFKNTKLPSSQTTRGASAPIDDSRIKKKIAARSV